MADTRALGEGTMKPFDNVIHSQEIAKMPLNDVVGYLEARILTCPAGKAYCLSYQAIFYIQYHKIKLSQMLQDYFARDLKDPDYKIFIKSKSRGNIYLSKVKVTI
jgi:hypothetical protein